MSSLKSLKAAQAKALEGLTGAARKQAQTAFYQANRDAFRAAHDAAAKAANKARQPKTDKIICKEAEAKGLKAYVLANIGLVQGSSYDEVVTVHGNTFAHKDILKAHGGHWNSARKCWVFKSKEAFMAALSEI